MNKQGLKGIEWLRGPNGEPGYTWNPIKGLCPMDCKTPDGKGYCYARKIAKRFGWNPKLRLDYKELSAPFHLKKPGQRIFVCSTFELFHEQVKPIWREEIFNVINAYPQHTFIILTKFPQNINRPMPPNVWLGATITKKDEMAPRIKALYRAKAKTKFISFEPLLEDISGFNFQGWLGKRVDWIVVGKLTGHGRKFDPKRIWIKNLVDNAEETSTPIFLKDNLIPIMGEKYVLEHREFPAKRTT